MMEYNQEFNYSYNMNSRIEVSIIDSDKDDIKNLQELLHMVHSEKYTPLKITVKFYQLPDNGKSKKYEIVKKQVYKINNYNELMDLFKYLYSQDRLNDLKYWNK